ncbi:MAG TPA: hypothetical protein VLK22_04675 [Candidatus Udaeobacter sp.]|nr:hypothetical protein [Candidatus Udaeobacter sp.]
MNKHRWINNDTDNPAAAAHNMSIDANYVQKNGINDDNPANDHGGGAG